jgi:hypothetical protein
LYLEMRIGWYLQPLVCVKGRVIATIISER